MHESKLKPRPITQEKKDWDDTHNWRSSRPYSTLTDIKQQDKVRKD